MVSTPIHLESIKHDRKQNTKGIKGCREALWKRSRSASRLVGYEKTRNGWQEKEKMCG